MTPKERKALITQIWRRKHPDYRSKRGDETHPSILWLDERDGTVLLPLERQSDAELERIWNKLKPKESAP